MRNTALFFFLASTSIACGGSSASPSMPGAEAGGSDGSSVGPTPDASTEDGGDAAPVNVTAAQACADSARARCQRFDACSNNTYNAIHYGDEPTCESALTSTCLTNLGAPGTGATPATVEACAQAIPGESCADYFGQNPPAACATPVGTIANGSACATSAQCQSTFCAVGASSLCGVCAAVPAVGATCSVAADCGSRGGLTCQNGACAAFVASGGACGKDAPCAPGFSCVGATKTASGTCQADGATVGASCDAKQATGPKCDPDLDLVCIASMCSAEMIATGSAACGVVSPGTVTRCGAAGVCVLSAPDAGPPSDAGAEAGSDGGADAGEVDAGAPMQGTCLPPAIVSGACDTASGPDCMAPAKCVVTTDGGTSGTCQVVDPSACH
jgi:hypothetical protein